VESADALRRNTVRI